MHQYSWSHIIVVDVRLRSFKSQEKNLLDSQWIQHDPANISFFGSEEIRFFPIIGTDYRITICQKSTSEWCALNRFWRLVVHNVSLQIKLKCCTFKKNNYKFRRTRAVEALQTHVPDARFVHALALCTRLVITLNIIIRWKQLSLSFTSLNVGMWFVVFSIMAKPLEPVHTQFPICPQKSDERVATKCVMKFILFAPSKIQCTMELSKISRKSCFLTLTSVFANTRRDSLF